MPVATQKSYQAAAAERMPLRELTTFSRFLIRSLFSHACLQQTPRPRRNASGAREQEALLVLSL
jgi:hypothetical protein